MASLLLDKYFSARAHTHIQQPVHAGLYYLAINLITTPD